MGDDQTLLRELHWMMDLVQSIDAGLVVVDEAHRICLWNSFMANHSGRPARDMLGQDLFELFPELRRSGLAHKLDSVFRLRTREFTTWEQRPFVFRFPPYRPFTAMAEHMYQNTTIIPVQSVDGAVRHAGIIVYDVTDTAVAKQGLQAANAQLERLSRTDALTQLYNRGYWEECLRREFRRVRRTHHPASLVLFDIDHFKRINDDYGHQAGDEVIRALAQTLRQTCRGTDIPGRFGGEEFGVILIDTLAERGRVFAERLRRQVAERVVRFGDEEIRFTVSLGIAGLDAVVESVDQWLQRADQALYQAKEGGRDRAVIYDPAAAAA